MKGAEHHLIYCAHKHSGEFWYIGEFIPAAAITFPICTITDKLHYTNSI